MMMLMEQESPEYKAALDLEAKNPDQAIARYKTIVATGTELA